MECKNGAGLVEIGIDAFVTLEEEYYGRTTWPPPPPPRNQERQQPQPNRTQQPFWSNRKSNMQFVSSTTYNTTPPIKENGVIDCNQAARIYGGVLIKDAGKRKPPFNLRRG
ncbi:hypothetical protein ACH5RR_031072 [Cinchona calisaya]|uniref:Uncharacterized protein n=1 Tax=Cinchona calisaya TaxID=153742 RepID=A0ABD2YIF7_9GENT